MNPPTPFLLRLRHLARSGGLFLCALLAVPLASSAASLEQLLSSATGKDLLTWGARYEHGEGVRRSADAAVMLYCRAAEDGIADAHYALGWMYTNGRGVRRNDALAAAWFAEAARNGDRHSRRMLARLGEPAEQRLCVRPNGQVYRGPVKSHPNPNVALVAQWVERLAPEHGLDAGLVMAVIRTESNFNPRARSAKNAQGLMQLIPATAKRFQVEDPWDPVQNIQGGMRYLRWLLDFFDGNEALALAGYNAGEGAVIRYKGVPPYAETRAYVKRVKLLRNRRARAGSS